MKLKLKIIIACFLLISFAAKSQSIIAGYNDNDVLSLRAFFAQTDGITTNGVKNDPTYDPSDVTTWKGISWDGSSPKRVTFINMTNKGFTGSFDCTGMDNLDRLDCYGNNLTSIKVSSNVLLTELHCENNLITSLNLAANTKLGILDCSYNNLGAIDVTNNKLLTSLFFSNCNISTINLSQNTKLNSLWCDKNNLTSLDLTANTLLDGIDCSSNKLTSLKVSDKVNLTKFYCNDNELKFSDLRYVNAVTNVVTAPQRAFIPKGVTTTGGTMAAATGGTIDLSLETNIGQVIGGSSPATAFRVWKKASDNTITEVTGQCTFSGNGGSIQLPSSANQGDSLFITMSNTSYTEFVTQTAPVPPLPTAMKTRIFALVGAAALPIELLSFTANLNNNKVDLAWSTASEKNNDFFTIERSINNRNWESVAKVDGAGNSNTQLNYSTIDANPLSGVSYYRLKQTDFDGKFEYSKTVVINRNAKTAIQLYPNPANNQISVTGNEADLNSIKIYNSLGQDVTKYTNYSASNTKEITIDISKLTTGIYILKTKNTTNRLIVR